MMTVIHDTYGEGRVRVLRLHREGDWHEIREDSVEAMLEGRFERA